MRALFGKLLCWLGRHRWRVTRVLKPHLYIEFGPMMGCDLLCERCGGESSWRRCEREQWESPFGGETENHPNPYCPCSLCANVRVAR